MLRSLGRFIVRHAWLVIAVWLAIGLAALAFAPRAGSISSAGGFSAVDLESERALRRFEADFGAIGTPLEIVFHSARMVATDPEFVAAARAALEPLGQIDIVERIEPFWENGSQVAPSGNTAYATVYIRVAPERAHSVVPLIRDRLGRSELSTYVAGSAVFYSDIQQLSEDDLRRAELIGIPFALLALLLVFGSVVAAAVPVLAGGTSVVIGLALIFGIGQLTNFSIFALNVVTLIGLGLGADYSLFLVSRFREELATGKPPAAAVIRTVDTAGRAVIFSGLAVLAGLSSLTFFEFMMLRSIGIGGVVVVLIALAAALTLVPAVLMVLGHRIDRLRVPRPQLGVRGGWRRLAHAVMRRPVPVFLGVTLLLVLMGLPFLHVRIRAPDASVLPPSSPSRVAFELLEAEFGPGHVAPLFLVVRLPRGALQTESLAELHALGLALEADPRVRRVFGVTNLDPRITLAQYRLLYRDPERIGDPYAAAVAGALVRERTAVLVVEPAEPASSDSARDLVFAIRDYRDRHNLDALVGGGAAGLTDFVDRLYSDFPKAVAGIVIVTYVMLVLLFRSVVLPLKAVIMNMLSLLASFGALVLVFQDGWLSNILRFERLGFVEATLPILLFAVLFGLSMDYEVFLLSRVKEAHDAGLDNAESVAVGLERSGRVITSAAVVVIVVSLAFVTADIVLIKAVGLGAAIAVFVDATIVRSLLVPATMRLLGEWNWWAPAWLPLPDWRNLP